MKATIASSVLSERKTDCLLRHTTSLKDWGSFLSFRNLNRTEARDEEYFRWRYMERPNGCQPHIMTAERDGFMMGYLSVIPHHYSMNGVVRRVGVIGDISVHEKYRRQGIARQMMTYAVTRAEMSQYACLLVIPNREIAALLRAAGWREIALLRRYVKVLSISSMATRFGMPPWAEALTRRVQSVFRTHLREQSLPAGYTWSIHEALDSDHDALWEASDKSGLLLALRNSAYLTWRYTEHPLVKYRVLTVRRSNGLRGCIIFHDSGDRIAHIDDLLFLHPGELKHLFSALSNYLRSTSLADMIYLRVNDTRLLPRRLIRHGFLRRPDYQSVFLYDTASTDTVGASRENDWFLTAGDKDT